MILKLKAAWLYLKSTLWFVPVIIVASAILLALVLVEIDAPKNYSNGLSSRLFTLGVGLGAEGSRTMLSAVAGSMMSVVGITFSMTLVALALASNQYTSRILRNFMRSRLTQVVIGLFVAIFSYCLIVLASIRDSSEGEFVPSLSIFFAFVLTLIGIYTLVFFIHHIASSIQASNILSSICSETYQMIDQTLAAKDNSEVVNQHPHIFEYTSDYFVLNALESGYLQTISHKKLIDIAVKNDLVIKINPAVGDFVVKDTPMVLIFPSALAAKNLHEDILAAFIQSNQRSIEQDISFGIRQIVDIALKALSPGVNDTTTAVMCINYLTAILVELTAKKFNSNLHFVDERLKLISQEVNFANFLDDSFFQVLESAQSNSAVLIAIIKSLKLVTAKLSQHADFQAVNIYIQTINNLTQSISFDRARDLILAEFHDLIDTFELKKNSLITE